MTSKLKGLMALSQLTPAKKALRRNLRRRGKLPQSLVNKILDRYTPQ